MSVSFYIAPYTIQMWENSTSDGKQLSNDLEIDPEEYGKSLLEHWPGVKIQPFRSGANSKELIQWILPTQRDGFAGLRIKLLPNRQIIAFEPGPKELFLEFILWQRKYVPHIYPLFLYNSSSPDSLELTLNTTEIDVMNFTGLIE